MVIRKILLLGAGGFIGSNLRYWISEWIASLFGVYFPYGTLVVNSLGSFLLGFLLIYGTEGTAVDPEIRLMLGTGLIGALTTFSTFSVETLNLLQKSNYIPAGLNLLLNILIGFSAAWFGIILARTII